MKTIGHNFCVEYQQTSRFAHQDLDYQRLVGLNAIIRSIGEGPLHSGLLESDSNQYSVWQDLQAEQKAHFIGTFCDGVYKFK